MHGTTGYEFGATVNNLFVDRRNERALDDIYRRVVRERRLSFPDLAYRCKKQVLHETMSGDINSLGHQLNRFSERNRHFRDFTLYSLISTLKEVIACVPGLPHLHHRRRADQRSRSPLHRRGGAIGAAAGAGGQRADVRLHRAAAARAHAVTSAEEDEEQGRFIGKLQQITSPVAAKGIEDTALYVYNRLVSLNEVGADPTQFGLEPAAVHDWMIARQRRSPSALSATSTHDTKRGEDVRARLNVLSEMPGAWKAAHTRWRAVNRRFKTEIRGPAAPDANEEYLIYQTLVGAWPFESGVATETAFRDRVVAYMTKALREAKVHTSWLSPTRSTRRRSSGSCARSSSAAGPTCFCSRSSRCSRGSRSSGSTTASRSC